MQTPKKRARKKEFKVIDEISKTKERY